MTLSTTPPVLAMARDGSFVRRYKQGEFLQVWRDIQNKGAIGGDLREEIIEVANLTMERVARNTDVLAERLTAHGWEPLFGSMHSPPNLSVILAENRVIETSSSGYPASLLSFWNVVGGIDFVWNYESSHDMPELGHQKSITDSDPLCVDAGEYFLVDLEEWPERRAAFSGDPEFSMMIALAPDDLHKDNISGGSEYGIEIPDWVADPVFVDRKLDLPFTDYLRLAFQYGGFPGLALFKGDTNIDIFVAKFSEDLEPF